MDRQEFKANKAAIRLFIQNHYSDQTLFDVLAFSRDGKFSYQSCCCLIGAATADHALQSRFSSGVPWDHCSAADHLLGARTAENAFCEIGHRPGAYFDTAEQEALRRRILIPMLLAEARRRELLRAENRDGLEGQLRPVDLSVEDPEEDPDWPVDTAGELDHQREEIAAIRRGE